MRNAGLRGLDSFLQAKKYNNDEPRKAVVTRDLRVALLRSWIHVLPISVFIALAFLNMKGYYIGSTLQGLVDPIWQTFDILLLQICAKLHVSSSLAWPFYVWPGNTQSANLTGRLLTTCRSYLLSRL